MREWVAAKNGVRDVDSGQFGKLVVRDEARRLGMC